MSTVLVVEDEPVIRRAIEVVLTREGHQVIYLSSGLEALPTLWHLRFDAMVLDLMPLGMSGVEFFDKLTDEQRMIPRLVISRGKRPWLEHVLALGATAWLPTPFKLAELTTALAAVLPSGGVGEPAEEPRLH